MQIVNHPYSSETFLKKWLTHFDKGQVAKQFDGIVGPFFLKKRFLPIYVNSGSNFTLQAFYGTVSSSFEDLRKKTLVIYDVPSYFDIHAKIDSSFVKLNRVKEYIGFLIRLDNYGTAEDYLRERFSSKNRSKFRSYKRKLEKSFPIYYNMFYGAIDKRHFEYLFDCLHDLSQKSFSHKKIKNRKLIPKNFDFLRDVTYDLILEKKACLFVIYDGEKPIGISLNFKSDSILFGDSTVYDLDYSKFNVGIVMLIKQIEWCIENKVSSYDFSKGYFPYKEKWCNVHYHFEHHIIHDSRHPTSFYIAFLITNFLRLKQYLREHYLRTFLKERVLKRKRNNYVNYNISANSCPIENKNKTAITEDGHPFLKKAVNDFLYTSSDSRTDIKIYKHIFQENTFSIQGRVKEQTVVFKT